MRIMQSMDAWIESVKALLALPGVGLGGLFVAAFLSATLLPLGSEALLYAVLSADRSLMVPAVLVATLGNTLGGAVTWWMGRGAEQVYERVATSPHHDRGLRWLTRLGPKACVFAWLPVVGDPLCAVAGWLRLPFWPCLAWMALGKFLRYLVLTALFVGVSMPGRTLG